MLFFGKKKKPRISTEEQFLAENPSLSLISEWLFILSDICDYDTLDSICKKADECKLPVFEALTSSMLLVRTKKDVLCVSRKLIRLARREYKIYSFSKKSEQRIAVCESENAWGPGSVSFDHIVEEAWEEIMACEHAETIRYGLTALQNLPWREISSKKSLKKAIVEGAKKAKQETLATSSP
jgi:hypothetical protein